jgi:hypothetical protein
MTYHMCCPAWPLPVDPPCNICHTAPAPPFRCRRTTDLLPLLAWYRLWLLVPSSLPPWPLVRCPLPTCVACRHLRQTAWPPSLSPYGSTCCLFWPLVRCSVRPPYYDCCCCAHRVCTRCCHDRRRRRCMIAAAAPTVATLVFFFAATRPAAPLLTCNVH